MVTHALLPALLGRRWIPRVRELPSLRIVALVCLSGALPDLLHPHLSLEARQASLSHTLWACLLFAVLVCVIARLSGKITRPVAWLCIAAYGGHIFLDGITGGVALLQPLSDRVSGGNYLPYWCWTASDILLLVEFYLAFRWLPMRRQWKRKRAAVPDADLRSGKDGQSGR